VRRDSRMALGKQEAAFGAAGVGYGGSSETSLDQSAVNQEYDALKTRYKGASTAYGYGVQSGIDKSEGNTEMTQSGLLAGSQLLKSLNMTPNYSIASSGLGGPG
jgi:cobalamin-dependent methionine synthase I